MNKKKRFSLISILIVVLLFISILIWYRVYQHYFITNPNPLSVTFLNIGQGDSILIRTPENKSILIDAGTFPREWSTFDAGKYVVVPYLKKLGLNKLDIVVASHPDLDHIGGLLYVLKKFPVSLFIDSGTISTTETYEDLLKLIDKNNIKYAIAKQETLNLGPNLDLEFLSPISKAFKDSPNNNSIVLKLTFNNLSFLFTGDITDIAEELYVNKYGNLLKSTILKVAHHGSNSSSSEIFLDSVVPEVAIISAGKNNPFGHPKKEVLDRFKDMKIDIYRTDKYGHITIITDGKTYKIRTQH